MSFVSSKGNILCRLIKIELYKIFAIINRAIKGLHSTFTNRPDGKLGCSLQDPASRHPSSPKCTTHRPLKEQVFKHFIWSPFCRNSQEDLNKLARR